MTSLPEKDIDSSAPKFLSGKGGPRSGGIAMKIREPITLEWLRAEENGRVNAKSLVNRRGFYKIPPDLLGDALAIPTGDGSILLHELCFDRRDLQRAPKDSLKPNLLLMHNIHGICPLQYAAEEGALSLIPWDSFSTWKWLPHLTLLKEYAAIDAINCGYGNSAAQLASFIDKIEVIARLKKRKRIKLES